MKCSYFSAPFVNCAQGGRRRRSFCSKETGEVMSCPCQPSRGQCQVSGPIRGRACPLPLTSVWSDSWCHYHPPGLRRGHRTALDTGKLQVTLTSGTKGEYFYPSSLSLPCLRRQMFCQQQEYCYKHFKPSVKI